MTSIDIATLGVLSWALLLQIIAALLSLLEQLDPHKNLEEAPRVYESDRSRVGGNGILGWLFSHALLTSRSESYQEERFYITPKSSLTLSTQDVKIYRAVARQVSLLSLAVIGLVRFASGVPILNFF